jgi:hypothetical protein
MKFRRDFSWHMLKSILLVVLVSSCQKELDIEDLPKFCGVSSITIIDGKTNAVTAVYSYEYDSFLLKPSKIIYENLSNGVTRTVKPTYAGDSIYLGGQGFITLDNSGKVSILNQANNMPGIDNGDYYYTYNNQGRIEQKLLDDGVDDAKRTNFIYTEDSLTGYRQDLPGHSQGLLATFSYASKLQLKGFLELANVEVFPELVLYLPCIKLGKLPTHPLSQIISARSVYGTLPKITVDYNNYTLTQEGWLSSFESNRNQEGGGTTKTIYKIDYLCTK